MADNQARPVEPDGPGPEAPQPEPAPRPEPAWQGYSPEVLDAVLEA